ncbi:MAG: tetratricopeptide repeat protein [Armatimonadetes bacterium]|nr:tetratricopeptide repeat protein [Armatimonadota bacterium]
MGARTLLALALLAAFRAACVAQDAGPPFRQLIRDGQRLSSVGNVRGASAKYAAAVEAAANDQELAEALTAHALAQRNLNREDQAEADLRRAVALPGAGTFRRPAMFQLAALLEGQDRLDEAIRLYREVAAELRASPTEAADALLAAARLLVENERLREAGEVLAGLKPETLPPHLRPEAASLRLEVYLGSGDLEAAKAAIAEAGVEGQQRASLYVRLARVLLDRERPDEAMKACETAIEADPGNPAAWRMQYDIATVQGTAEQLTTALEAKLEADPTNEVLLQRLASYAESDEDPDRASVIFRKLLALRPDDVNLLERAGSLAAQAGRNEEALGYYEAALKAQPDDPGLCQMLGEVQAKLGHHAEAVALFKRSAGFRPGNADSARRLGMVLTRSGLYDEAVQVYREARASVHDPNALAYELAQALAPGDPAGALGEYVRAASVSIDDADIVAPEAVKLARETDLLPKLAELTEASLREAATPGLALLLTLTQAAQGNVGPALKRAVELGLSPQNLLLIAEALEVEGNREAAAQAYAAVAAHPNASPGLRLELAARVAEGQITAGRREEARALLQSALGEGGGPPELVDRAAFMLADLDLSGGQDLAEAKETFARLAARASQPDLGRRAKWRLADVAFAQGDFAEAERLYRELASAPDLDISLPPPPPDLDILRGRGPMAALILGGTPPGSDPRTTPAYAASQIAECAFRKGDLQRAKALFAEVAEKYPDSVYANDAVERRLFISTHFSNPRSATEAYLAALTQARTDQWEAALEQLRLVAEAGLTEPLADDAALLAASILEAHGRLAEAAAAYRALPDTFPGTLLAPEALLNAARMARTSGDEAQAKEDLGRLLQNSPTAPMAKIAALWLDDLEHGRPWPSP